MKYNLTKLIFINFASNRLDFELISNINDIGFIVNSMDYQSKETHKGTGLT